MAFRLERDSRLTITLGLNKLQSLFAIATSDEFFKNIYGKYFFDFLQQKLGFK